jgi:hypothetical protein
MDTEEVETKYAHKVANMPQTALATSEKLRDKDRAGMLELAPGSTAADQASAPLLSTPLHKDDLNGDGIVEHLEQLENTKRVMNEQLQVFGVEVRSITITNVHLPPDIASTMEQATTFDSKNREQVAAQQYNLLTIADTESLQKASQELREKLAEKDSENERKQMEEKKETANVQAETERVTADLRSSTRADVMRIEADNAVTVSKLNKEAELELASLVAKGAAEARKIKAEMDAYILTLQAQTDVRVAKCHAATLQISAAAEAKASQGLVAKREHEAKLGHMHAIYNMALNPNVQITSSSDGSVLGQLIGAQKGAGVLGIAASDSSK